MEPQRTATVSQVWPERVIELSMEWSRIAGEKRRLHLLSEMWLLLNAALFKYLRLHGGNMAPVDVEDLKDIASQKSLELLQKLDSGAWNPGGDNAARLCSFISLVARNGLVDHIRLTEGRRSMVTARLTNAGIPFQDGATAAAITIDRARFVEALKNCVFALRPRVRTMWYLRVMFEMSSKKIACHPLVNCAPEAVDVALGRCRKQIKECMRSKGFGPEDMPPGTFTELWEAFGRNRPG